MKRKQKFEGQIDILSDLSIERCVQRLENLQDDDVIFTFHPKNSDVIAFTAQLYERGVIRADARGYLRRWQGTLTRVDCEVRIREGLMRWLFLFAGLCLLTMIALPIMLFLVAAVNPMIWIGMSLIFVVVLAGLMKIVNHYAPLDDTPQNLLEIIASALQ